ncbi:MAG TPA: DUF2934 domain-containing protein [Bdellovibrionota bacterium]|nr:DUF2934 domain-containing protein [Bdellovibrionota bacterium]
METVKNIFSTGAASATERKTTTPGTRPRSSRQAGMSSVAPEERQRMIAEAAYFIAERRGFWGGDPNADWLEAESQIDRLYNSR